jgi:hypothetical protein
MTEAGRFVRRNRVNERNAALIAVAAGVLAALAGAEPTGSTVVDVLIVVVAVGSVVWAAASAPWWAAAGAAGIAAATALDPLVAAVGALGFAGGLHIGIKRKDQSEVRAVVAAIAMNCLIRSELDGFLGLSAIVGIAVGLFLLISGLRRRPAAVRRIGWISIASVGGLVTIALVGLALAGNAARPDLTEGAREARRALTTLNSGDYETAAQQFDVAAAAFRRADDRLGGVLAAPSRLIPGVAQNVSAGANLSSAAADGTERAAAALRSVDPEALRVVDGAIDIDAIRAVEAPLADVQQVLFDLQAASADAKSPWLVGRLNDELVDLDERLVSNEPRLVNAIDAVRLAPQILGADTPRRYLVLFTTPVEARGLAGFTGNYAVLTIDNGAIDVSDFGRRSDLERFVAENPATCDGCPQEFLDRYGRFGITGGDEFGGFGARAWSSLTLPAHFPYVGQATQVVFPQSGGDPIDGVIAMDPYVIQALMGYTGPVDVPELGITVSPDNAADFILRDQYEFVDAELTSNADRIDALETIGTEVIRRLLQGSLPPPSDIARDLGPLAGEQRLLFWTDEPDEQALFDRIGLLGALPELGPDGGFGMTVSNFGNSKIDYYLDRSVDVTVDTADDGTRTMIADVTLTNNAPASGLPRYVIGNSFGLPTGTSRLWVNFFGPDTLRSATRDGEPIELAKTVEAGWTAFELDEVLASGSSVTYRLEFDLGPGAGGEPIVWTQPLVRAAP